jgi:hypothetical protein
VRNVKVWKRFSRAPRGELTNLSPIRLNDVSVYSTKSEKRFPMVRVACVFVGAQVACEQLFIHRYVGMGDHVVKEAASVSAFVTALGQAKFPLGSTHVFCFTGRMVLRLLNPRPRMPWDCGCATSEYDMVVAISTA